MSVISGATTVISVRGRNPNELLADPDFAYVGRRISRGDTSRWPSSDWGNPFKPGMTQEAVFRMVARWRKLGAIDRAIMVSDSPTPVQLYLRWLLANGELRSRLHELRGKTLGCWCGDWKPGDPEIGCHAVVLATLADGPMGDRDGAANIERG